MKCNCDYCKEGRKEVIVHFPPNWSQTLKDRVIFEKQAKTDKFIRTGTFMCCIL